VVLSGTRRSPETAVTDESMSPQGTVVLPYYVAPQIEANADSGIRRRHDGAGDRRGRVDETSGGSHLPALPLMRAGEDDEARRCWEEGLGEKGRSGHALPPRMLGGPRRGIEKRALTSWRSAVDAAVGLREYAAADEDLRRIPRRPAIY